MLASAFDRAPAAQSVILPALNAVERASAEAITSNRRVYDALPNHDAHAAASTICLGAGTTARRPRWVCCQPRRFQIRGGICWKHIERLKAWQHSICLLASEWPVHQTACSHCPRGRPDDTRRPRATRAPQRRAYAISWRWPPSATVTDEIIDLHDRIPVRCLTLPRISISSSSSASGKAINAKVRLYGRIGQGADRRQQSGRDAFAAIEAVMSGIPLPRASPRRRSSRNPMTSISCIASARATPPLRRYAPEFLAVSLRCTAPAAKKQTCLMPLSVLGAA